MITCVVSPLDQIFPVVADEVNVTLPPWQNVKVPVTVTVGLIGVPFNDTAVTADVADVQAPLITETE